ncbi:hypothetical protein APV28_4010 [Comamonas testosteroni]|nr:hypothetical protein APV28_4010 [Comamonas testosteroni]
MLGKRLLHQGHQRWILGRVNVRRNSLWICIQPRTLTHSSVSVSYRLIRPL